MKKERERGLMLGNEDRIVVFGTDRLKSEVIESLYLSTKYNLECIVNRLQIRNMMEINRI